MKTISTLILCTCSAWSWKLALALAPAKMKPTLSTRASKVPSRTVLRTSVSDSSSSMQDLSDKILYQRVWHTLSPQSDVASHDALSIEERIRFVLDPDREGYLLPIGLRTLILLDDQKKPFYSINVHDPRHGKAHNGYSSDLNSTLVLILYLASNPKLLQGRVLELSCHLGLGSLLASIALAHLAAQDVQDDVDLLLPSKTKDKVAIASSVDVLTLTEPNEQDLNAAFQNVKSSGVLSSKIILEELDWSHRQRSIPRSLNRQSDDPGQRFVRTLVGADLDVTYPTAKQLARTVAHLLLPDDGIFVHVCPDNRPDLPYLHKLLREGYLMQTNLGYLKLQSHAFHYQTLSKEQPETDLDKLALSEQTVKSSTFESLTAFHCSEYNGFNGEYVFPIETGKFDGGRRDTSLERESSGGPWY